ncbi:MAG: NAD-dependent epimerase/dehydratase family protein [Burkholderiales bacterium]
MRIAVTGATGFIGRHLVSRHLMIGDEVRVFGRRPAFQRGVQSFAGDLVTDTKYLPAFVDGADVLYHCAGELKKKPVMRLLHVNGTGNLAAAADRRIGRWVQLSSTGAYGTLRDGIIDEFTTTAPTGVYEKTKTEADELVEQASAAGAFSYAILRPSIVFGPDMPNQSLRQLISVIARGFFLFIGPPGASANYIYIDNVIDALIACATMPAAKDKVFNLSDYCTMEQFVRAIAMSMGKPMPQIRLPELPARCIAHVLGRLSGFPLTVSRLNALTSRARYPSTRIERQLGYVHRVSMEDGLRRMVESWRQGHV